MVVPSKLIVITSYPVQQWQWATGLAKKLGNEQFSRQLMSHNKTYSISELRILDS